MMDDGKPSSREEQARRLAESMKRQLGAFCPLLAERGVVELMLNADGTTLGRPSWPADEGGRQRCSCVHAESFIATVASTLRSTVTRDNPILECELPADPPFDGSRFEALVPPVVSAPVFTIRRKASAVFTLEEYERQGIMSAWQRSAIETAVARASEYSGRRRNHHGQDHTRERDHRSDGSGRATTSSGHHRGHQRRSSARRRTRSACAPPIPWTCSAC